MKKLNDYQKNNLRAGFFGSLASSMFSNSWQTIGAVSTGLSLLTSTTSQFLNIGVNSTMNNQYIPSSYSYNSYYESYSEPKKETIPSYICNTKNPIITYF